jgi:hypothetical protein
LPRSPTASELAARIGDATIEQDYAQAMLIAVLGGQFELVAPVVATTPCSLSAWLPAG